MENQPMEGIEMVISKPLAMSAMKRDTLAKENEIVEEKEPVKAEGQAEIAVEKEIK